MGLNVVSAKKVADASSNTLHVGSFNFWSAEARDWQINTNHRADPIRLWSASGILVARMIIDSEMDILGCQECNYDIRNTLPQMVKNLGGKYKFLWFVCDPLNPTNSGACGICYRADRFKISRSGMFYISQTPDIKSIGWDEAHHLRVAGWAEIYDKKTKRSFFMIATHGPLKHKANDSWGPLILEREKMYNTKRLPSILVGDMNAAPDWKFSKLMRTYYDDAFEAAKKKNPNIIGTFTGAGQDESNFGRWWRRIDYVYVHADEPGTYEIEEYKVFTNKYQLGKHLLFPSDHCPVSARIKFLK